MIVFLKENNLQVLFKSIDHHKVVIAILTSAPAIINILKNVKFSVSADSKL